MDNRAFLNALTEKIGSDASRTTQLTEVLLSILKNNFAPSTAIAIPSFGTFTTDKHDECVSTDAEGHRWLNPPRIEIGFTPAAMLRNSIKNTASR